MSRITLPEYTTETKSEDFQYSYETDSPSVPGEGKVWLVAYRQARRSYSSKGPMPTLPPNVTNLLDNFEHGVLAAGWCAA